MAENPFTPSRGEKKKKPPAASFWLIPLVFLVCWAGGEAAALGAPGASVLGVRQFSTAGYARIVLILDRETFDFTSGVLKRPTRIFVDIPRGRVGRSVRLPKFPTGRSVVSRLRFGRPEKNNLRLVLDIPPKHDFRHRIFTLPNPQRIVIDVRAKSGLASKSPTRRGAAAPSKAGKSARARRPPPRERPAGKLDRREMTLAQRFRRGLGRIVLDPGHGGKDPGASGLYGLKEKDVALDIAFRTRRILRRVLPGNRIYLTRTTDRYVSLSRRTSFANEHDADLFVSIHANSAHSRRAHGVETYLLSEASSKRALALAARESKTTVARMTALQKILHDLGLRSKVTESRALARRVQEAMLSRLRPGYRGVRDLGVKRGPFYVLIGARMPSILIEVAFISNRREARRVKRPAYRQALAEGIAKGMMRFVGVGYRKAEVRAPAR